MLNFIFTKTPLLFFIQSFWRDEAFTYLLAKRNIFDLLLLTAKDFNPPLYYLIVHYWMKLFGSSEISLRGISLIFYWLTIYCIYLFITNVMRVHSKRKWLYLLLAILNPILLYYAFEARMYTMLAFFATLSFYSFFRKQYKTFIVTTVLGLYTHYFMTFVLLGELLFNYFTKKRKFSKTELLKYVFPFLLFVPWILFVLNVKDFSSQAFWIDKSTLGTFAQLIGFLYTGFDYGLHFYHTMITLLSIGLTSFLIIGIWYLVKKTHIDKKLLFYLILWSIGIPIIVVLISFFKPIFFPRYVIFCSVGLVLLIIYILEHLHSTIRYLLLIVLLLLTINFHTQQVKDRKKSDLRRIFKEIKYLAKPTDVVYVTNELNFFTGQYYFARYSTVPGFDENRVYIYGKSSEEIPDYVGKILMLKSKFVNTLPIYPNKAFVLTSDSNYEIQAAR